MSDRSVDRRFHFAYFDGIECNGDCNPNADLVHNLGISAKRWKTIYAGNLIVKEKWDDIRVPVTSVKTGGLKDPAFQQLLTNGALSVGVYTYAFGNEGLAANEEELFFTVQVPHNWKEGSNIVPHIHWCPIDATAGNVVWGLEYTLASVGATLPVTNIIYTDPSPAAGAFLHTYAIFDPIDCAGNTISFMIVCRVFRNSSNVLDTLAQEAAMLEIDFHYLIDSLGSEKQLVK